MEIIDIVNNILERESENATVLEIIKTGSQVFKEETGDLDFTIICSNYSQRYKVVKENIDGVDYDLMFYDLEAIKKRHSFTDLYYVPNRIKLYNYFFNLREAVYGKVDYNGDMLEHKNEYLQGLKTEYNNTIGKRKQRLRSLKKWVHYYCILKIYENNKVEITTEMKQDIETLYNSVTGEGTHIVKGIEEQLNKI